MKILRNALKNELHIRTQKNFPQEGVEFIDIMPLIIQKETFTEIVDKFVEEIKDKHVEYIVGAEARGFIIGAAVASKLNIGFIPVRKAGKLPPTTVEKQFTYEKEYGKDEMELPKLVNEDYKGKREPRCHCGIVSCRKVGQRVGTGGGRCLYGCCQTGPRL